jgi:hypothetical protein
MQRRDRVVVVELETLDERAVEDSRSRGARCATPADQRCRTNALETHDGRDCGAGPRQLRAHEGTSKTVEKKMTSTLADPDGNVIQCGGREPVGDSPGRPIRISCRIGAGHDFGR